MTRAGASLARLGLTEPWAEDTLTELGWWAGDSPADGAEQIMWALARSPDPSLALRTAERLVAAVTDRPGARRRAARGRGPAGAAVRPARQLDRARRPPRRPPRPLAPAARRPTPRRGRRRAASAPARGGRRRARPLRPRASAGGGAATVTGSAAVARPAHRVPRRAAGAGRRRPRPRSASPSCRCSTSRTSPPGSPTSPRAALRAALAVAVAEAGRPRRTRAGSRSSRWASAAAAS